MRDWEMSRIRDRAMRENERALENIGKERRVAPTARVQPVLTQIREDFERIQVVNNEMIRSTSGGNTPDFEFISNRASEIKKRAARLKTNMAFPETGDGEKGVGDRAPSDNEWKALLSALDSLIKGAPDSGQMKTSLSALAVLIKNFVANPLFGNSRISDATLMTSARRDLENIIELSGRIRKSAETMNKTLKKLR